MDAFAAAEWKWAPCIALVLAAAWTWLRAALDWCSIRKAPHRNLRHMVAFRKLVLGVGFAGVGLGWWIGNPVLFWFGLVVAIEEVIESSIALEGLRLEANEVHLPRRTR